MTEGAHEQRCTLRVGTLEVRCAEAMPEPMSPHGPGVIVVHDIFGLTAVTQGHVDRIAQHGYVTVAPDLLGLGRTKLACVVRTMRDFRRGSGPAWEILDAARAHLVTRWRVDPDRIGVIGFCMGGGFALLYAARANLAVAAPFYGEAPKAILEADDLCPVVGGWGGRDMLFAAHGRRLDDHLSRIGTDHDIVVYPGAGHSYMDDHKGLLARLGRPPPLRARYDAAAADDSWARVFTFLDTHL